MSGSSAAAWCGALPREGVVVEIANFQFSIGRR